MPADLVRDHTLPGWQEGELRAASGRAAFPTSGPGLLASAGSEGLPSRESRGVHSQRPSLGPSKWEEGVGKTTDHLGEHPSALVEVWDPNLSSYSGCSWRPRELRGGGACPGGAGPQEDSSAVLGLGPGAGLQ